MTNLDRINRDKDRRNEILRTHNLREVTKISNELRNWHYNRKSHKPAAVKNMEEAKRIKEKGMWYIYMVECADGTIYTGISNNVSKRILAHNSGKGAKYTKTRLPVTLKWSQSCENRSEASKEEYKIKKLSRKEKLQKIEEYER
tara:strand:+ start:3444 stop:3875 length:432 start_codon:yes stop_codon:yes gene_type:complete